MTNTFDLLRDDHPVMNNLFQAVIEATEEAVYINDACGNDGRSKGRVVEKWPLSSLG